MRPKDVVQLAEELMTQHGLIARGWRFELDGAKRRLGCCHRDSMVISVSKHLSALNGPEIIRNTMLHEIAHALAGPGAGHGRKWQSLAISIGCDGQRCYSGTVAVPKAPYIGVCPNPDCGHSTTAHRRRNVACRDCCTRFNSGKYSVAFKLKWSKAV